jgi:prepilin-type N-terminal cleavage/methylation domain-containing protein
MARRNAFTLTELLIVMAIIVILVSLTAGGVMAYIGVQRVTNTEIVLKQVDALLRMHWRAVIDEARESPKLNSDLPAGVIDLGGASGGLDNNGHRARVIWIKMHLKRAFPMSYAEAVNGVSGVFDIHTITLPSPKVYADTVAGKNGKPETQSSACLLMALGINRRGLQTITDVIGRGSIADTDGDGLPEIIDGWGNPIDFCRWPWQHPDFAAIPNVYNRDTEDPDGLLTDPNWSVNRASGFASVIGYPPVDNASYKLFPMIASRGKNGRLGLNPATGGVIDNKDASDNLYNY